jgi:hypothetical protein
MTLQLHSGFYLVNLLGTQSIIWLLLGVAVVVMVVAAQVVCLQPQLL